MSVDRAFRNKVPGENDSGWGGVGVLSGFSYGTGWVAWSDSTNELVAIKREGVKVKIRGLFRRTSGADATSLTIPTTYRPSRTTYRACVINSAAGVIAVTSAGAVNVVSAYTNGQFMAIDIQYDIDQP